MRKRLRRGFRMWQRNLDVFRRYYLASIVGNIGEPILTLFAFGVGIGMLVKRVGGMSYLQFIAPGMMTAAAMNAAAFECTFGSYTRMAEQRTYESIMATPLSAEDIVLGEVMWGATKGLLSSSIVLVVLILFGLFDRFALIPLILLNMAAIGLAISCISIGVSALSTNYEFFNYFFTLFLTPMLLFTGIYFPADQMPKWFYSLFLVFPVPHAVNINRYLFHGGSATMPVAGVLFLAVFIPLGIRACTWMVRRRLIPAA